MIEKGELHLVLVDQIPHPSLNSSGPGEAVSTQGSDRTDLAALCLGEQPEQHHGLRLAGGPDLNEHLLARDTGIHEATDLSIEGPPLGLLLTANPGVSPVHPRRSTRPHLVRHLTFYLLGTTVIESHTHHLDQRGALQTDTTTQPQMIKTTVTLDVADWAVLGCLLSITPNSPTVASALKQSGWGQLVRPERLKRIHRAIDHQLNEKRIDFNF